MADPIDVFISYAPKDEALREELAAHLALLRKSGEIRAFDASHHTAAVPVVPSGASGRFRACPGQRLEEAVFKRTG